MSDPPTTTMPSPPTEPRKRRWLLPTVVGVGTFVRGLLIGDQPTAGPAEPTATVTVTATAAPAEPADLPRRRRHHHHRKPQPMTPYPTKAGL